MFPVCLWHCRRRSEPMRCIRGLVCVLVLLLTGCQGSGNEGRLAPQASAAPAVERQAVDNLVRLYQTALRQADIDRVEALLAPAEAVSASPIARRPQRGR